MGIIKWSRDLSVNVTEFDAQHQRLFQMINDLNDAMLCGKGKEMIAKTIGALADYTSTHFAAEERQFDRLGYPERATHKKEHAEFSKKVGEFRTKLANGQAALSTEVMTFMTDWLKNHIKGTDKKYSSFFDANGVK